MAEAMAIADIAVFSEISVDIVLRTVADLIQTAGIFRPTDVEILPEGRCTEIKHGSVIGFQRFQNFFRRATLRHAVQNVVAHKGGKSVGSAVSQTFRGILVGNIGEEQEGSNLLE